MSFHCCLPTSTPPSSLLCVVVHNPQSNSNSSTSDLTVRTPFIAYAGKSPFIHIVALTPALHFAPPSPISPLPMTPTTPFSSSQSPLFTPPTDADADFSFSNVENDTTTTPTPPILPSILLSVPSYRPPEPQHVMSRDSAHLGGLDVVSEVVASLAVVGVEGEGEGGDFEGSGYAYVVSGSSCPPCIRFWKIQDSDFEQDGTTGTGKSDSSSSTSVSATPVWSMGCAVPGLGRLPWNRPQAHDPTMISAQSYGAVNCLLVVKDSASSIVLGGGSRGTVFGVWIEKSGVILKESVDTFKVPAPAGVGSVGQVVALQSLKKGAIGIGTERGVVAIVRFVGSGKQRSSTFFDLSKIEVMATFSAGSDLTTDALFWEKLCPEEEEAGEASIIPESVVVAGWNQEVWRIAGRIVGFGSEANPGEKLVGHRGAVTRVSFVPEALKRTIPKVGEEFHSDGTTAISRAGFCSNYLASCSADGSVKFWNLRKQQCMHSFIAHRGKVNDMALFSVDVDGETRHLMVTVADVTSVRDRDVQIENAKIWNVEGLVQLVNEEHDQRERLEYVCNELSDVEISLKNVTLSVSSSLLRKEFTGCETFDVDDMLAIDNDVLTRLLWGYDDVEIDPLLLVEYYRLFRHLRMPLAMAVICNFAKKSLTQTSLLGALYLRSCDLEEEGVLVLSPNSALTLQLLNLLKGARHELHKSASFVEGFRARSDRSLDDFLHDLDVFHPGDIFESADLCSVKTLASSVTTFEGRFKEQLKKIHAGEDFNLVLRASDGTLIRAHKEILAFRSSFFHRLFMFPGSELSDELAVDLPSSELRAFVDYVYLRTVTVEDLHVLAGMLVMAEMYFEFDLLHEVVAKLMDVLDWNFYREGKLIAELRENGSWFLQIPEQLLMGLLSQWSEEFGIEEEDLFSYMMESARKREAEGEQ